MRHLWEDGEDGITCVVTMFLKSVFKLGCTPLFFSISMAPLECGYCFFFPPSILSAAAIQEVNLDTILMKLRAQNGGV